jgi:hypothetical protein
VTPDPFDRPLDAMLERLRVHDIRYEWHTDQLDRWDLSCPICAASTTLREPYKGAAVTVRCDGGCHESRILAALAAEPHGYDAGLELAEAVSALAWRALELLESSCR